MKTKEEVRARIQELEDYFNEGHYSTTTKIELDVLKSVLNSTDEEINTYHEYMVKKVRPNATYEKREAKRKEAEEYYNKYLKGKKSKNRESLIEHWHSLEPLEYDEYLWGGYRAICWLFEENPYD